MIRGKETPCASSDPKRQEPKIVSVRNYSPNDVYPRTLETHIQGHSSHVDRQAAFKVLDFNKIRSTLVWKCFIIKPKLGVLNNVTLYWVPGHTTISKTECADMMPTKILSAKFEGSEVFCDISKRISMCYADQQHLGSGRA